MAQARPRQRPVKPGKQIALVLATLGMATMSFGRTRLGEWTLSDLFFALAGLVLLADRIGPTRQRHTARSPALSPMVLGTGLLLTTATLSSLVAVEPLESIGVVLRLAWLSLIWLWILQGVAPAVKDVRLLLRGVRWTVFISSTIAIGGYLGILNLSDRINETRETGLYTHPNHLGAMLIVGLPFIILDAPTPRSGPRSLLWRLGLACYTILAIMTTGSLTTALGVVAVLATLVSTVGLSRNPYRKRSHPFIRIVSLFVIAIAVGYFLQSSTPVTERLSRLGDTESDTAESARSRADHADAVVSNLDQLLVLGVGLDRTSATIDLREGQPGSDESSTGVEEEVHNIYLKLIHNAGMPAFVGFVIVVLTSLRKVWMLVIHSRGNEIYTTAVALTASLVAINVVAQFRTPLYQRYFWVPIVLIATLWSAYKNDLRHNHEATSFAPALSGNQGNTQRADPSSDPSPIGHRL